MTGISLSPRLRRPLLLLDIDGVIALLGTGTEPTVDLVAAGLPVTVSVNARERVSRLADVFQIVWASSWMRDGAESLAPLLGLPDDLPYIRFDPGADNPYGSYKLEAVNRFVRDRPAAWVDDELGEDMVAWAEHRVSPTLLVSTDPRYGLLDDDVDDLLDFASKQTA